MNNQIIINQIIILSVWILIGVIATFIKVINEQVKESISRIVFYITLPLLIVTTFSNMNLNQDIIRNGFWVIVFSFISFVFLYVSGVLTSYVSRLKNKSRDIHIVHTMFGNIAFLGFPMIHALFPVKESVFFAALYYLVSTLVMWTFGVFIFIKGKQVGWKNLLRNFINPNIIAFFIGILIMASGIQLPEIIYKPLSEMGKTTTYLAMLYIGAVLAQTNIKGVFRKWDIYLLSLNKLLLIPFLLALLIHYTVQLLGIDMDMMARTVVILETGMPCMSMVVIIARNYGGDDRKAAENVFLTTVFSMATLPFLYWLIGKFCFL